MSGGSGSAHSRADAGPDHPTAPQAAASAAGRRSFFLGRQSLLAGHFLQFRQIGIWVAAKAGAQSARLTPLIETLTELLPLPAICAAQIGAAGWMLTGCDGRDQARLTA